MARLAAKTPLRAKQTLKSRAVLKARLTPKRQTKPTITKLRKMADALFSLAVRYRDGKLRGDGNWYAECITCGEWRLLKQMHAGHFQSRRHPATRWDYENVNAQCAGCNRFNGGEQYKYGLAVDLKYGEGTAAKLARMARQDFKVTRAFLEEVIATAKREIEFYEKQGINND